MAISTQKEFNIGILCQGQGSQKPGMFRELLGSQNPHVKEAAGELIEGILKRAKPEVVDIYFSENPDPVKVNSTVNVQPAIAVAALVLQRALGRMVGQEIAPDIASGYSFGNFVATGALNVLSDRDLLNLAVLRGEVFTPVKPGQFYVTTLFTKDTAHVHLLNLSLRGTGYRVTIRSAPRIVTIAGPNNRADALEGKLAELQEDGTIDHVKQLDKDVFYVPFHHCNELRDVATFFESQLTKYCRRESAERGGQRVFQNPTGVFVTNDGRKLTGGTDIMHYLARNHIKNLCDFARTMEIVGKYAATVIGIGDLNFQKSVAEREGYIRNFVVVRSVADLGAAATAYSSVLEQRARQGIRLTPAAAEASAVQPVQQLPAPTD